MRPTPSDQVVVGEGEGQPHAAGRTERLARHHGHLHFRQQQIGQFQAGFHACVRRWVAPMTLLE